MRRREGGGRDAPEGMEPHCMGTPAQRCVENALKAVCAECDARENGSE